MFTTDRLQNRYSLGFAVPAICCVLLAFSLLGMLSLETRYGFSIASNQLLLVVSSLLSLLLIQQNRRLGRRCHLATSQLPSTDCHHVLREVINSINANIAVLDRHGTIVEINSHWLQFAEQNQFDGRTCGLDTNYFDILRESKSTSASDIVFGMQQVIDEVIELFELEYDYPCLSGSLWCKISVTRIELGSEPFLIVALENISNQKSAESRLANERSKFRTIYDSASDAIMLLDRDGFFDCNPRTLQLFGIERHEDFLKYHPNDLSPEFQEDGCKSLEKANLQIGIAYQLGENRFEWLHRRVDGTVFPAEVLLCSFELNGRQVLQATVRDITIRKQQEHQLIELNARLQIDLQARAEAEASLREMTSYLDVYRQIVDKHAIVAETDVKGTIVYVNQAFCEISGYSFAELVGQNHRILNSGVHSDELWRDMYKYVAKGGIWHGEICNRAKCGRLYWVATTISPLFAEDGKLRGYFAIRSDITELKNAQVQAESSNRAKTEFLANMSHEIRTPMTAILGFADLLAEEIDQTLSPDQIEYINTIKRNGQHLLAIINDILDISKIEAEKMEVEKIETDPFKIVDDVLSSMHVKASAKGLVLDARLLTPIPKVIRSDPTRVRQILENLVGNAIKFTDVGGISIHVGVDDNAPNQLAFSVIDTGIGIEPEQAGKLFEPFEQGDSSTTRRFGGSGLGLRISKRLAELLGGSLTLTSEYGKGSVFTARIQTHVGDDVPIVSVYEGSSHTSSILKPIAAPGRQRLRGFRILLAEDGADNQRLIRFHLEKAGATVQIADNGKKAVQLMTSDGTIDGPLDLASNYDLLISDVQMPVMDGLSAVKLLRKKGCTLPILALTAHAMIGDREKCLEAGCDAHLTKPIDPNLLVDACENWILTNMNQNSAKHNMCTSQYSNDPEMAELISEYVATFSEKATLFKEKLEQRCFEDLGRLAHQLKGSGGGFGFPLISQAAAKVESNIKSKAPTSDVQLATIEDAVTELVELLDKVRQYSESDHQCM